MVSELDRWRIARQLIKQNGPGTELDAAQRANKAVAAGEPAGESLWQDLLKKVQQLQQTTRPHDRLN